MNCSQLFHINCRTPPFCSTWWSHKESHLEMIEGQPHPSRGMTPPLWNLWMSCFNSDLENSFKKCSTYHIWNIFRNGGIITKQSCNSYRFYFPPTFRRRWCPPCRTECSLNFHWKRFSLSPLISFIDMKPCKLNDQDCIRLQATSEVSKICILPVWEMKYIRERSARGC